MEAVGNWEVDRRELARVSEWNLSIVRGGARKVKKPRHDAIGNFKQNFLRLCLDVHTKAVGIEMRFISNQCMY